MLTFLLVWLLAGEPRIHDWWLVALIACYAGELAGQVIYLRRLQKVEKAIDTLKAFERVKEVLNR